MTTYAWDSLSKAERKEVERLSRRHRDIRVLGAGALEVQKEREAKQLERQAWVTANGLRCFLCQRTSGEWAAGGRNKWGRLWAVCASCIRRPRAA